MRENWLCLVELWRTITVERLFVNFHVVVNRHSVTVSAISLCICLVGRKHDKAINTLLLCHTPCPEKKQLFFCYNFHCCFQISITFACSLSDECLTMRHKIIDFTPRMYASYLEKLWEPKSWQMVQFRVTVSKNSTSKEKKTIIMSGKSWCIGTLYSCQTDISDRICAGVQ